MRHLLALAVLAAFPAFADGPFPAARKSFACESPAVPQCVIVGTYNPRLPERNIECTCVAPAVVTADDVSCTVSIVYFAGHASSAIRAQHGPACDDASTRLALAATLARLLGDSR